MITAGQETLKILRVKAGLTQKELAKLVGVSLPTYCIWENNPNMIKAGNLKRIAEVLGVGVCDIFLPDDVNETDIGVN